MSSKNLEIGHFTFSISEGRLRNVKPRGEGGGDGVGSPV